MANKLILSLVLALVAAFAITAGVAFSSAASLVDDATSFLGQDTAAVAETADLE